ncbi:MAG: HIT family protein [Candidatus Pacearchaeota archaeon]|nr:HIT family protein [Candidatus Pacearchaeota archaeon]
MIDKNCVFCKIAVGKVKGKIVKETDNFFVIRDIKPVSEGHSLVIPKKHFVTLLDIPYNLGSEMLKLLEEVSGELIDKKLGDGFNLVMNNLEVAGQIVMHAHFHVIPRKEGDGVRFLQKVSGNSGKK